MRHGEAEDFACAGSTKRPARLFECRSGGGHVVEDNDVSVGNVLQARGREASAKIFEPLGAVLFGLAFGVPCFNEEVAPYFKKVSAVQCFQGICQKLTLVKTPFP